MTPMAPRKNLNDGSGITALRAFVMGSQRLRKRFVPKKAAAAERFDRRPNMLQGR